MITVPRALVRRWWAVLGRIASRAAATLTLEAGKDGLRARLHQAPIHAEHHLAGAWEAEVIDLPMTALAGLDRRDHTPVTVQSGQGSVIVAWQELGKSRENRFPAIDCADLPNFPRRPDTFTASEPRLLQALADASETVGLPARYALNQIQLRGRTGEVVASDDKQLLIQAGFAFGWEEDLLVPASPGFASAELAASKQLRIGKTDTHVVLELGQWTLYLPIDQQSRYPRVEQVLPAARKFAARCCVTADDAAFLLRSLPAWRTDERELPVTVDLNGRAVIRSKPPGQERATELVLARSVVEGRPVRTTVIGRLLRRALQLGFQEMAVVNGDSPLVCADSLRRYVCISLGQSQAIAAGDDPLVVVSTEARPTKRRKEVSDRSSDVEIDCQKLTQRASASSVDVSVLIEEAITLRAALHDAFVRCDRLVVALKRQRQESRALHKALVTLRQLQQVAP